MEYIFLGTGWFVALILAAVLNVTYKRMAKVKKIKVMSEPLISEADYAAYLNKFLQGRLEYILEDRTRVDILTETLAIEIDWAHKWYEAVGQAAHYSVSTDRQPCVLLIAKSKKDEKYINAAKRAIPHIVVNDTNITLLIYRNY